MAAITENQTTDAIKTRKQKRTRRNFAAELRDIENFCEINIDVLRGLGPTPTSHDNIAAFERVLARIRGTK